jgi:hypothetical protein
MIRNYFIVIIWVLMIWLVVGAWRLRKRRVTLGPAAGASMTALMDDQRRDPEDKDGIFRTLPVRGDSSSVWGCEQEHTETAKRPNGRSPSDKGESP